MSTNEISQEGPSTKELSATELPVIHEDNLLQDFIELAELGIEVSISLHLGGSIVSGMLVGGGEVLRSADW